MNTCVDLNSIPPDARAAVVSGDLDALRAVLRAGAGAEGCLADGTPFLAHAMISESTAMVAILIEAGAAPTESQWQLITGATGGGGRGSAMDPLNDADGYTVLHQASSYGFVGTVTQMLERGADANAANEYSGEAALHCASHPSTDSVEVCAALFEHGARPNAMNFRRERARDYCGERCAALFRSLKPAGRRRAKVH